MTLILKLSDGLLTDLMKEMVELLASCPTVHGWTATGLTVFASALNRNFRQARKNGKNNI